MPFFVVHAVDKQGASDVRTKHRPAHRARLRHTDGMPLKVHVGGPLTDDQGQMTGTLLVVESATKALVERFIDGDPYNVAGLYECVDIHAFAWGLGQPEGTLYG